VIATRDPSCLVRFMQLYNLLVDRSSGTPILDRLYNTIAIHKLQVDGENLAASGLR
jgi:hypothetical protein